MNPYYTTEFLRQLAQADHVLIGAGAGMSAAAGIDYTDARRFAQLFPRMVERGFRTNYELMGYSGWVPAVQWGYFARHVQFVYYDNQQHPVYQQLRQLVAGKDVFVMTSNVDGMFPKNGFDPARFYSPQGNYAKLQCLRPCSDDTWDIRPTLDRLLAALDPVTHQITDPAAIPRCPHCGGEVFMNVRGGGWFVEQPYQEQRRRFGEWLQATMAGRLLCLDFGTGFNTPGVIRWPLEQITHQHPQAHLMRINRDYPQVPHELQGKAQSVAGPIDQVLQAWHTAATATAAR